MPASNLDEDQNTVTNKDTSSVKQKGVIDNISDEKHIELRLCSKAAIQSLGS